MKAILEFNLPEEQEEFDNASQGGKMKFVIWKLDQYLRAKVKYASDMTNDEVIETYEEVRNELWQIADSVNLNFQE